MAVFTKYECFVGDLANKVHDLLGTAGSGADTLKVMLSNTAPNVATHATRTDAVEIAAGNGYTSGGATVANVGTRTGGTLTIVATDVVFTAAGGAMGPFRYVVVYNDTSPSDSLVNYYDYGSALTLADTETFTIDFGASLLALT
jgi:hypothetical protein